eukprot:g5804.t1
MCPVMTDEPIDPRFTSTYQGQTVGLCCRKCLTKFRASPDQYIANIPELRTVAMNEPEDPHTGSALAGEHAETTQPIAPEDARHEEVRSEDANEPPTDPIPLATLNHGDGQDHPTDHDPGARWIAWIGKFHVPMTHLPIGMLIGAIIAELGVIATGRAFFRHAAGFCVIVAALSAVVAATLGWVNGGWVLWDEDWAQAIHRWLGSVTAGLTLLTLATFAASQRPTHATHAVSRYRVLLFLDTQADRAPRRLPKAYARFGAMIVTSSCVMYAMTYVNSSSIDHVYWSETRVYMAVLMGAAMSVVMLVFMLHMLRHTLANIAIVALSAAVFACALLLVRSQTTVQDVSWMRAMIPHHSIAILTSERAEIEDPRVRRLADRIVEAQRREIDEMKALIADLRPGG